MDVRLDFQQVAWLAACGIKVRAGAVEIFIEWNAAIDLSSIGFDPGGDEFLACRATGERFGVYGGEGQVIGSIPCAQHACEQGEES